MKTLIFHLQKINLGGRVGDGRGNDFSSVLENNKNQEIFSGKILIKFQCETMHLPTILKFFPLPPERFNRRTNQKHQKTIQVDEIFKVY